MQQRVAVLLRIIVLVGIAASYCLGRAGGGGGGHASSSHSYSGNSSYNSQGDSGAVFLLTMLVVGAVLVYLAMQNHQLKVTLNEKLIAAKDLTDELSKHDPIWDLRTMTSRVNEVFFKVQAAWTERNQELARDCMSDKIYRRHKELTDQMIASKRRNVLENIMLAEVLIYSVTDYQDNTRDTFAAQLTGSMVGYTIKEARGYVTVGDRINSEEFTEVWFFVRQNNQWVLDEIAPVATAEIISRGRSYSES